MENVETERLIEEFMEAGLKAFKSERKRSSEARRVAWMLQPQATRSLCRLTPTAT